MSKEGMVTCQGGHQEEGRPRAQVPRPAPPHHWAAPTPLPLYRARPGCKELRLHSGDNTRFEEGNLSKSINMIRPQFISSGHNASGHHTPFEDFMEFVSLLIFVFSLLSSKVQPLKIHNTQTSLTLQWTSRHPTPPTPRSSSGNDQAHLLPDTRHKSLVTSWSGLT